MSVDKFQSTRLERIVGVDVAKDVATGAGEAFVYGVGDVLVFL